VLSASDAGSGSPKRSVLLYFPMLFPFQRPIYPPLELLALSAALDATGLSAEIIDERIDGHSAFHRALSMAGAALLLGISCRPGRQTREALKLAQAVKAQWPSLPVVLGGWFPSVLPAVCAAQPNIDYVIAGAGEEALPRLALTLIKADGRPPASSDLAAIPNLWRKGDGGQAVPPSICRLPDIADSPPMPYHSIELRQYLGPEREVNYLSSRGCPRACSFCAIQAVYPGQWTGLPAERMAEETTALAAQYGIRLLRFTDMDFFADPQRVIQYARALRQCGAAFHWRAAGHVRHLEQINADGWAVLAASGLSDVELGCETGSDTLNRQLCKAAPGAAVEAQLERIVAVGITPHVNFMFGAPGESDAEFEQSLGLLERIHARWPSAHFVFYRYSPIPGTVPGELVYDAGVHRPDPQRLADFSMYVGDDRMPWLSAERERQVKRAHLFYLPLLFSKSPRAQRLPGITILRRLARRRLRQPSRWAPEWLAFVGLTRLGVLNKWRLYSWK